jgi:predicted negative regulator of RcsB-dependent stress response
MDEEISIINSNSRNDKIKNFIFDNKNKIISSIITILIVIVGFYSFDKYKINKKKKDFRGFQFSNY